METTLKEGKYLYCITESNETRSFGPLGIGDRGDELYTICHGGIAAVVSSAPIKKYRVSRDNSLAHEKAIETVMIEHPVLPVRFATIAEDEDKVRRILEAEHEKFKYLLNDVRDKTELGLKAMFKEEVIYKEILEKYEDIRSRKETIAALDPGKSHLQRMEIGRMVEDALQNENQIAKNDILNVLSPLAVEVRLNNTYGELMIINAAFFVARSKESDFDRQVHDLDDRYGEKIRFKYVGPLPPFNFINIVIETEKY